MRPITISTALVLAAIGLAGCTAEEPAPEAVAEAPAPEVVMPPFKSIIPTAVLMRTMVTMAAEGYWESTAIIVDAEGVHENYPQTDEEWFEVWSAAITLAESGNILMMPAHALDQGEWMRLAQDLVDAGFEAARAADDQDFMRVLDEGEKIYNVCTECHEKYVPSIRL